MSIQSNYPSIKPSLLLDFANTKQLDSRITFTRASTGSLYDGVTTAKAEENLLLRSQEFDNASAWSQTTGIGTPTANSTTAPDGTTTADTITCSATTSTHRIGQSVTMAAADQAVSVYAKAGTHNFIQFSIGNQSVYANFNITSGAGVTGTSSGITSSSITDVGSGWYRCTMIYTNTVGNTINVYLVSGASSARNESWTAVGTETVYLWGAQLEQRSAVTAYTATTTQAITNYIPKLQSAASGVARFDNNPTTGESLGLLIEESRTNLLTYSSQFDDASWTKSATTITPNIVVAPDGTLTGDLLLETATTAGHYIQQTVNVTNGTVYTASCYIKPNGRTTIEFYMGFVFNIKFDLTGNGSVTAVTGGTGGTITSVGNGWFRITATGTASSTSATIFALYGIPDSGYAGDSFKGWFIWGAQFEAGAFATSYIPTVASQVTRAADAASMTGANFSTWFNQGQGTIYSDSLPLTAVSSARVLSISDNTATNRMMVIASNVNHFFVTSNGTNVADLDGGAYSSTTTNRQGSAYAVSDYAVSLNSGTVATSTSGALPSGLNRLYIGANHDGTALFLNGTIKKIAYYPIKVTNAQLQALTS